MANYTYHIIANDPTVPRFIPGSASFIERFNASQGRVNFGLTASSEQEALKIAKSRGYTQVTVKLNGNVLIDETAFIDTEDAPF